MKAKHNKDLQHSDYRIRKLIGVLGLFLPILVYFSGEELLASISHYYYKPLPSLFFIIILSVFGLFLLSYKGYKFDSKTETISDDILTNIGGIAALVVVFVPTCCKESLSASIDIVCRDGNYPLLGHGNTFKNTIHLVAAGVFMFTMGWMSKFKFTRSSNDVNNTIYKICGNLVWASIALIVVFIILEDYDIVLTKYYVFIFETTAIIPFGISWLVKGEVLDNVSDIFAKKEK
ncbi:hypothetical protein [Neotamlana laminarinivorans]|uniref:DUF998 domain-containing protein n=1 Tax=Neotamlana laminarinivorans TaxID=2883124 RepID=A0A9X1I0B8_9FLAO|nr:hypothetical protein [Tamlana laminarinivorans]MCB4799081.1 hypothetical protein [Tamlana laminarinivorans]